MEPEFSGEGDWILPRWMVFVRYLDGPAGFVGETQRGGNAVGFLPGVHMEVSDMIVSVAATTSPTRAALRRGEIERLLMRAEVLDAGDAALLRAVLDRGLRFSELARAAGVDPRAIRRRYHRLVARLLSSRTTFILRERETWPLARRRAAETVHLQGRPQRAAAKQLGLSLHYLRAELHAIDLLWHHARDRGELGPAFAGRRVSAEARDAS